jgi:hypothetical protein
MGDLLWEINLETVEHEYEQEHEYDFLPPLALHPKIV